ncbi:MAG: hypothetical protein NTV94_12385 [Planctomycetota bacterium]|nr:hypothetical protein [Planctomycetota bacterium]
MTPVTTVPLLRSMHPESGLVFVESMAHAAGSGGDFRFESRRNVAASTLRFRTFKDEKNTMNKTLISTAALLVVCAASAHASIVPISSSRSLLVSRSLSVPGADYQQNFDKYDHPGLFDTMNERVHVEGGQGSIAQASEARQFSSLMVDRKVVYVESSLSVAPGVWYRGLNARGQAGAISEFYFMADVRQSVDVTFSAQSRGYISPATTLNADISVLRNGQMMYNYNLAPTGGDFVGGDFTQFTLNPGVWEFSVTINGSGNGGASDGTTRMGDMSLLFGVAEIPNTGACMTLAMAGLITASRRRR